jgi:hypothetical protein
MHPVATLEFILLLVAVLGPELLALRPHPLLSWKKS